MSGTFIENPIAWAHFKVRGGWRNHLWTTGGYVLLITAAISITAKFSPARSTLGGWTTGLLGLQMALPLFLGCGMINGAIRRDITAGLLESHRLMPISAGSAILGYLTGATFQVTSLAVATFLIGVATTTLSGVPIEKWLMANLVVALFVLFLWVLVAYASFVAKSAFSLLIGLIVPSVMSGGKVIEMLPGLSVLVTPIAGNSIFMGFVRGSPVGQGYAWAFAAQIVFAAIFFRGAMRRYRRDDIPALGVLLGMLLLAAWVATSAVGIVRWADFQQSWMNPRFREREVDHVVQVIAALLSSMLIGLAPVGASARISADWTRTFIVTARRPGQRPLPPPLIACLAACITLLLIILVPPPGFSSVRAAVEVGVVLVSFFLSASYLLRIFYRAGRKAAMLLAAWLVLTWLIPLGIDSLRHSVLDLDERPFFSLLSPWGALIDIWSEVPTHAIWGLALQALLAGGIAVLFYAREPKPRAHAAVAPVQ